MRDLSGLQTHGNICFREFGNLVNPAAQVFEITSLTKKISFLNKFSELKYCFWYAACESVAYLLASVFAFHVVTYRLYCEF